jgi:hypothetical protein
MQGTPGGHAKRSPTQAGSRGDDANGRVTEKIDQLISCIAGSRELMLSLPNIVDNLTGDIRQRLTTESRRMYSPALERIVISSLRVAAEELSSDDGARGRLSKQESELEQAIETLHRQRGS